MILLDSIQNFLNVIIGIAGGIIFLLWLAVVIWAIRDIRARSRSGWAIFFTALLVGLLPILGLVVYLLLRPRETLAESYDRALEQEALLQQLEEKPVCPTCSRPTQPNWYLCPTCHTHLRHPCPVCNSPLELHWDICPYCGYLFKSEEVVDSSEPSTEMIEDTPAHSETHE